MENKSIRFINRRGFTLIEVLFSLAICLLIVINVLPIVKIVTSKNNINVNTSFYAMGAKQVAKILYTAKNITILFISTTFFSFFVSLFISSPVMSI